MTFDGHSAKRIKTEEVRLKLNGLMHEQRLALASLFRVRFLVCACTRIRFLKVSEFFKFLTT